MAKAAAPLITPFVGSKISLITTSNIRYEGTLFTLNRKESTISVKDVRSYGTESRKASQRVEQSNEIYDLIIFRGEELKDLTVIEEANSEKPGGVSAEVWQNAKELKLWNDWSSPNRIYDSQIKANGYTLLTDENSLHNVNDQPGAYEPVVNLHTMTTPCETGHVDNSMQYIGEVFRQWKDQHERTSAAAAVEKQQQQELLKQQLQQQQQVQLQQQQQEGLQIQLQHLQQLQFQDQMQLQLQEQLQQEQLRQEQLQQQLQMQQQVQWSNCDMGQRQWGDIWPINDVQGVNQMEAPPHLLQSQMEAPPHLLQSQLSQMEAPPHLLQSQLSQMEAPPHLLQQMEAPPHLLQAQQSQIEAQPHLVQSQQTQMEPQDQWSRMWDRTHDSGEEWQVPTLAPTRPVDTENWRADGRDALWEDRKASPDGLLVPRRLSTPPRLASARSADPVPSSPTKRRTQPLSDRPRADKPFERVGRTMARGRSPPDSEGETRRSTDHLTKEDRRSEDARQERGGRRFSSLNDVFNFHQGSEPVLLEQLSLNGTLAWSARQLRSLSERSPLIYHVYLDFVNYCLPQNKSMDDENLWEKFADATRKTFESHYQQAETPRAPPPISSADSASFPAASSTKPAGLPPQNAGQARTSRADSDFPPLGAARPPPSVRTDDRGNQPNTRHEAARQDCSRRNPTLADFAQKDAKRTKVKDRVPSGLKKKVSVTSGTLRENPQSLQREDGTWNCPRCTLRNEAFLQECAACACPLEHASTLSEFPPLGM